MELSDEIINKMFHKTGINYMFGRNKFNSHYGKHCNCRLRYIEDPQALNDETPGNGFYDKKLRVCPLNKIIFCRDKHNGFLGRMRCNAKLENIIKVVNKLAKLDDAIRQMEATHL